MDEWSPLMDIGTQLLAPGGAAFAGIKFGIRSFVKRVERIESKMDNLANAVALLDRRVSRLEGRIEARGGVS